MKNLRASLATLFPLAAFLAALLLVGCGGAGGGSSSGGAGGGNSGGGSGGGGTGGGGTGGGGTGGTGSGAGVVYFLSDRGGPLGIYRVNVDGTGAAAVSAETEVGAPCVSWDGAVIAYEKWSLYGDVFKMGADGTNPTPIYKPGLDCLNPCLSPDGQAVIFSMNNSGVPQLFRTSVGGEGLAQVTNEAEGVSWGRYSPDGTKIVFVTSSGDVDVKIMDADGGNIRTVASGYQIQDMPTFSPDGASLVYMENFGSDFTPNYQIMKVAVAGGAAVRMTTTNEDDRSPCFSEDGNYLLFTRKVGAAREIFRMGVTGGTAAQVSTFGAWTGWLSAKKR